MKEETVLIHLRFTGETGFLSFCRLTMIAYLA